MSQSQDLHRALLRPAIIHTLRAVGFHSTRPAVLDTLVNLAERHMILLASSTAAHAFASHNDPVPTISDVRAALQDAGSLIPLTGAGEEAWRERMRRSLTDMGRSVERGGERRIAAERRKRDEEDTRDVREFTKWFDAPLHREIRRVAGMLPTDATGVAGGLSVGVGGGVVQAEDFLTVLKKRHGKIGDDARLQGTVLGRPAEERDVVVDGGPVASLREWRPPVDERALAAVDSAKEDEDMIEAEDSSETTLHGTDATMTEVEATG